MLSLHLDIPLVLPLSLTGSWTPVQGSDFGSGQPRLGVQRHCHCPGCAESLSPPGICSLAAPAAASASDTKERLLCKALPHPCCLLPRTEGIEEFPKRGTRISGKNLGPPPFPGEGGPLCPNRAVWRGLELHSACWCQLLWADTVTPMSPQGSGTGLVPCLVLGIALGPCPVLWLWQELTPNTLRSQTCPGATQVGSV